MVIVFRSSKLGKLCNSLKKAQRAWGTRGGKLVMRRLDEIKAADNLKILKAVHTRCHPLKGNRKGQWSVDLEHPYRLIFEPANEPLPLHEDGGLDIERVTAVRIIAVEDTHG